MKSHFFWALAVLAACFATPWAAWHQSRIKKLGRPLTLGEQELAEALKLVDYGRIIIYEVDRVPNPLYPLLYMLKRYGASFITKAAGITLGQGIYVSREHADSPDLIAHELAHVAQYQRVGSIWAFMVEYIHQCLMVGYYDAEWEVEARREAVRLMRILKSQP